MEPCQANDQSSHYGQETTVLVGYACAYHARNPTETEEALFTAIGAKENSEYLLEQ